MTIRIGTFRSLCSSTSMKVDEDRFSEARLIVMIVSILLVFVCCCAGLVYLSCGAGENSFPYDTRKDHINWICCELHEDVSHALCKIFSQLLITFCSAISSAALSGAFDETSGDNGILAIAMSCLVILLGVPKLRYSDNKTPNKTELAVVVGISTFCDAIFDILQGIALIHGFEYNDDSAVLLVIGTFIGLSEEIVDLIHTMVSGAFESAEEIGDEVIPMVRTVAFFIEPFLFIELVMGIVIFAGFDGNTGFVVAAIFLHSVGLIFVFLLIGFHVLCFSAL